MRRTTQLMGQYKAENFTGENIKINNCKGGYFSVIEDYGLKVVGKTVQDGTPTPDVPVDIQCVKVGSEIQISNGALINNIITPRDLYEGDIWYPMTGKVILNNSKEKVRVIGKYKTTFGVRFNSNWSMNIVTIEGKAMSSHFNKAKYWMYDNFPGYYVANNYGLTTPWVQSNPTSNIVAYCASSSYDNNGFVDMTVEGFNTWLNDNDVYVVYKLKTPVTKQYDPQLAFTYRGTTNIMQSPIEAAANLSATHLVRSVN